MIVCICNVLREGDCREAAVDPSVRRAHCVYRRLGCRVRCGACVETMQAIVEELRVEREAGTTSPNDGLSEARELATSGPGAS